MQKSICFILVLAFLSTGLVLAENRLTKRSVESMLNSLTQAIQAKDAKGVMRHMAPDAKIRFEVRGQKATITTDQYRAMLDQSWSQSSEYTYKVTEQDVRVAPDGKSAQVTDTTHETIVINGKTMKQKMQESVVVELREGKPVITMLSASDV